MRIKYFIISICCGCLAAGSGLCYSQNPAPTTLSHADSMPAWIVPVLKLVSASLVEPTTGVVISDTGLVLVTDNFASADDEIIVLDGGTDIIRNGRPARIEQRFPEQGLMVLSVKSLKRNAARFSVDKLADGKSIRLRAFPPAEQIEQGAPPLDVTATVSILPENDKFVLSSDTPLPNVSGPIVDVCGNLTGYSSADGVQSMSVSQAPRYHWKKSLLAILNQMQIDVTETPCEPLPAAVETEPEIAAETMDEPKQEPQPEPAPPEQEVAPPEPEAALDEETNTEENPTVAEPDLEEEALPELEVPPPPEESHTPEDTKTGSAQEDSGVPVWAWLLAAILLLGSAFALYWIRNNRNLNATHTATKKQAPPSPARDINTDEDYQVPGLDSLLVIEGILTDGTTFRQSCEVSRNAINIVLGRGNSDINIDSAAVSRQHVRLNGTGEMLTITDLGSSNGTSINGIPCLEDETMYIEAGDVIILGNARFSYSIIPADNR